jgi:hypothetical protein
MRDPGWLARRGLAWAVAATLLATVAHGAEAPTSGQANAAVLIAMVGGFVLGIIATRMDSRRWHGGTRDGSTLAGHTRCEKCAR